MGVSGARYDDLAVSSRIAERWDFWGRRSAKTQAGAGAVGLVGHFWEARRWRFGNRRLGFSGGIKGGCQLLEGGIRVVGVPPNPAWLAAGMQRSTLNSQD
jgi:hypothetical protein